MTAKKISRAETPAEADSAEVETQATPEGVDADSLASVEAAEPAPAPKKKAAPARAAQPYAVVGGGDRDDVVYSAAQPPSKTGGRKSLTVHHLQRRLKEIGFPAAFADVDGRYGAMTELGVRQYQDSVGAPDTGLLTREQFEAVFEGDPNVRVIVDTHVDHV